MLVDNIQRWYFDADEQGLLVCRCGKDIHDNCVLERVAPIEVLDLVKGMRRALVKIAGVNGAMSASDMQSTARQVLCVNEHMSAHSLSWASTTPALRQEGSDKTPSHRLRTGCGNAIYAR